MNYIRQTQKGRSIYTMQDVCLVCGDYLPEGSGMTCSYCSLWVNKERIRREWSGDKAASHNRVRATANR